MKRTTIISLVAASALFAGTVNINSGWNLVGAVEDVNPSNIECARTVWTFDGYNWNWSLYQTMNQVDNYGYTPLTQINKGQGFWVNSECSTVLDFAESNDTVEDNTTTTVMDINATPVAPLEIGSFGTAYNTDEGNDWYALFDIDTLNETIMITDYEKDSNGTWVIEDSFDANYTTTSPWSMTLTEYDDNGSLAFSGDMVINSTYQINSVDGIPFVELFMSDVNFTVTHSTFEGPEALDWAPQDCSTGTCYPITNTSDFRDNLLVNDNWFSDDDYAMLNGMPGTIAGDIVSGTVVSTFACDQDGDGNQNEICEEVERTTNVIGSWTYDAIEDEIYMDLPDEEQYLSVMPDANSETGYFVYGDSKDKVGSVWNETLFTGEDASDATIQYYINNSQ